MKSFFQEFKAFALRGNVLDLAVGVVIGTAFTNITNSLVNNVLTPPLGLLTGQINFKDLVLNLGGTVEIQYGLFLQSVVTFVITAFALFVMIRFINRLSHKQQLEDAKNDGTAVSSEKPQDVLLLEEIRDLLKNK